MRTDHATHRSLLERAYCETPGACRDAKVVILGGGLGVDAGSQLLHHLDATGRLCAPGEIAVLDAGGLDLLTHLGNTLLPRIHLMQQSLERMFGRTVLWGLASPRPREERLKRWPYKFEELTQRFDRFEREMGIPE